MTATRVLVVSGCDDSTTITLEDVSHETLAVYSQLCRIVNENATAHCQPTMHLYTPPEYRERYDWLFDDE